jgi:hypothetical protein
MRLSNNIRKASLQEKMNEIKPRLDLMITEAGYDPNDYEDLQDLIDIITPMMRPVEVGAVNRFNKIYRLWASCPKENHTDHWMYPLCSSTETHLPRTMDELYGREDYRTIVLDHINDFLSMIQKHLTLFHDPDVGYIIYTQVDEKGDGLLRRTSMIHPYFGSATLHEFFKLMLEWQWAKIHTGSVEPAAEAADTLLSHFGLNVDNAESDPVVRDLMQLPDQQIAQYFKTGSCVLSEEEPDMPLSFRLWATENNLMEEPRPRLAQLYRACVSYNSMKLEIYRL